MGTNVIAAADRRLSSWKEIGSFFKRDQRTVKRWEVTRGLPVYRVPGTGGTKVFGFAGELTAWLRSRGTPSPAGTASVRSRQDGSAARRIHPQAHELCLAGMYYCDLLTPDGLNRALQHFAQAVAIDPDYAESHTGLATCYLHLRRFALMPEAEACAKAKAAAERALALDETLPEAHGILGAVAFYASWDVPAALRAFNRALEVDPNSSITHHRHALVLLHVGHFEQALAEIAAAQELNPVYRSVLADKGRILFHAGRQAEAVTLLHQLAQAAPGFLPPHACLAAVALAEGDYPLYLDSALRVASLRGDDNGRAVALAGQQGFARGGRVGMASAMLAERRRLHAHGLATSYDLAQAHALAGDGTAAMDQLRRAFDRRESSLLNLVIDPAFDGLHCDAGFRHLVDRLGFELPSRTRPRTARGALFAKTEVLAPV
jgi:tetratricopeptide (TPR) repeat protein